MYTILLTVVALGLYAGQCEGHGRLVDPPSRASAWRYGFNTPVNYNDNQLYCGGKQVQWEQYGGRCGVCGDSYGGPREHEAGGRYATGTIVRNYQPGQVIQVKVELTANHKGWFEFRLCPNNNPRRRVTQSCLDRYVLPLASGGGTRFPVSSDMNMVTLNLRLPSGVTCSQCMLQWKYNAGNSWGTDPRTGRGCVGCGPQEQFYGCADVSIGGSQGQNRKQPNDRNPIRSQNVPRRENWQSGNREGNNGWNAGSRYVPHRGNSGSPAGPRDRPHGGITGSYGGATASGGRCVAAGAWTGNRDMDQWCRTNCALNNCPSSHCRCS